MEGHTPIPANDAPFSTEEVVRSTRGALVRGESLRSHRGVASDSRAVQPGGIFFALEGERFDGHAFLGQAVSAGATLVVVRRGVRVDMQGADVVEVDDTLTALGDLARHHLARWRAQRNPTENPSGNQVFVGERKVVAITGSAGKTTTKELTRALLAEVGPTHATAGNLNNRIGVPFVLFALRQEHRFVVLEMGMSLPGEIEKLASIADPDVAIVTNIGVAHAEGAGGPLGVAREKGALFAALRPGATAIRNLLDDKVTSQMHRTCATVVSFGKVGADYALEQLEILSAGGASSAQIPPSVPVCLRLRTPLSTFEVRFPLLGEAAAIDFLAALAASEVAVGRALSPVEIQAALDALPEIGGRSALRRCKDGTLILDDSYNANPTSMEAAIQSAAALARAERRRFVVVLGEMRELGPISEEEHRRIGALLGSLEPDAILGCGGDVSYLLEELAHSSAIVYSAKDSEEAAKMAVTTVVQPGDLVLVKGSRSVQTERVVRALVDRSDVRPTEQATA